MTLHPPIPTPPTLPADGGAIGASTPPPLALTQSAAVPGASPAPAAAAAPPVAPTTPSGAVAAAPPPHNVAAPLSQAASAASATDGAPSSESADESEPSGAAVPGYLTEVPSWLVSLVVHMAVLIVLGLLTIENLPDAMLQTEMALSEEAPELDEPLQEPIIPHLPIEPFEPVEVDEQPETDNIQDLTQFSEAHDLTAAPIFLDIDPLAKNSALLSEIFETGTFAGTELAGRGEAAKRRLLMQNGGNGRSEEAVARALKWLADHQARDGGWSFDHEHGNDCRGRCSQAGSGREARLGATAMALLPFLGAGHTHMDGKYREVVKRGLYYLVGAQKDNGSMHEPRGSMYSHGLASIALCEAYAMTKDPALRMHAQRAVDFIVEAQDPSGGGWRYNPRQAGDTSVVGWQIMALKSAHMSYLNVPPDTVIKAGKFLDHVQHGGGANASASEVGAFYGYVGPEGGTTVRSATTAIGLLCRMYLGWRREHPALQHGVAWLGEHGPSKTNMYYNYYATQVLHHYGGDVWRRWNSQMRDWLISEQAQQGHETGSWYMRDPHIGPGGRLYCTSMATMILEVYYRHLPIYRQQSTTDDFRLD
jgi:hypothetical protein